MKNLFENNKCIGVRIILLIVIILLLFTIIAYLALNQVVNIDFDLGSLLGGVIGGAATVIAFLFTINYYRKRDIERDRSSIEPNLTCKVDYILEPIELKSTEYNKSLFSLGEYAVFRPVKFGEIVTEYQCSYLLLKNNGRETAVDVKLELLRESGTGKVSMPLGSIAKNEEIKFLVEGIYLGKYILILNYEDINHFDGHVYQDKWELLVHENYLTKKYGVTPSTRRFVREYNQKK